MTCAMRHPYRALVWRTQLPGAQFHARRYAVSATGSCSIIPLREPGIAGIVEVVSTAYPDATQFDPRSKYFDPKATAELRAGSASMSNSLPAKQRLFLSVLSVVS